KKKILILGGFGFIGSNIIEALIRTNLYDVIVFEFKGVTNKFPGLLTVYHGDFNNEDDLVEVFKNHRIDIVVHLISTTVPSTSNSNIVYDISSNLVGTIRLLDIMLQYQVRNIVFLSSGGTVYGEINESKASENHPTSPISSHGIIKLSIEKYLILYNRLHDMQYLILRVSNPYGEHHNSTKQGFINVVIKKVLSNEKIVVWGDGSIIRDFIYVKDLAEIVVRLLGRSIFNEIINIGSGEGYSINQILEYIGDNHHIEIEYKPSRKYDIQKIILNIDKLLSIEKFTFTAIKKGIYLTYQLCKANEEERNWAR
ncbi:MAG: NAD-dependent epimerase/dehydratase family protein, partial [Syntrophales bacterium]